MTDQPENPIRAGESTGTDPDIAAFSVFYTAFAPRLVGFLIWQGAQFVDAAEIAQDTMTKAWASWSDIASPQAWARKVAGRELVRRLVDAAGHPVVDSTEWAALLRADTDQDAFEQRHDILKALTRLPFRQRQVMAWTLDGYAPAEIAEILETTSETVRSNLKKARRAMVAHLEGETR